MRPRTRGPKTINVRVGSFMRLPGREPNEHDNADQHIYRIGAEISVLEGPGDFAESECCASGPLYKTFIDELLIENAPEEAEEPISGLDEEGVVEFVDTVFFPEDFVDSSESDFERIREAFAPLPILTTPLFPTEMVDNARRRSS